MTSMNPVQGHNAVPAFTKEQELHAYREMLLIRRFEEKAGQLYGMGFIGGFCHLYIGQEAVVVGMQMAIKPGDQVITTYRDHGHMLAIGMAPDEIMAELTGREGGSSRGKGGSMHMFSVDKQFFGGHGIVGANVPLGAGLAFANKYRSASASRAGPAAARSRQRGSRSAPGWPSPTATARTTMSASPISATAPPIRVRSTRRSTWPSSGRCR